MWYTKAMKHYTALKKEIVSQATVWMNLKYNMLSEIVGHERTEMV